MTRPPARPVSDRARRSRAGVWQTCEGALKRHNRGPSSVGGFLDDLFVDPSARGEGSVEALLAALRTIGVERGWTVIRWITADDNYRARAKYDQQARRTPWITYDMTPES